MTKTCTQPTWDKKQQHARGDCGHMDTMPCIKSYGTLLDLMPQSVRHTDGSLLHACMHACMQYAAALPRRLPGLPSTNNQQLLQSRSLATFQRLARPFAPRPMPYLGTATCSDGRSLLVASAGMNRSILAWMRPPQAGEPHYLHLTVAQDDSIRCQLHCCCQVPTCLPDLACTYIPNNSSLIPKARSLLGLSSLYEQQKEPSKEQKEHQPTGRRSRQNERQAKRKSNATSITTTSASTSSPTSPSFPSPKPILDSLPFDPLTTSATTLAKLVGTGSLTSVDLVDVYLAAIERHNRSGRQLRALISTAPRYHLFALARRLDDERSAGRCRGPLHGVPVVLQDNIVTCAAADDVPTTPTSTTTTTTISAAEAGPPAGDAGVYAAVAGHGMDTTLGSYAFVGARPKRAASVTQRLERAGLIVIGKSNLSELCGLKSETMASGWSAVGGQTLSPFVARRFDRDSDAWVWEQSLATPAEGSAFGSAVAVAAGFSPLAVATDAMGGLVDVASRNGLYSLKMTAGSVPLDGVWCTSRSFDGVGGIAKSASDLVALTDAIAEPSMIGDDYYPRGFQKFSVQKSWSGLRVGFVDPRVWKPGRELAKTSPEAQTYMIAMYGAAVRRVREQGAIVSYPVQAPSPQIFQDSERGSFEAVTYHEFKELSADYLDNLDTSRVHSLPDVIDFNTKHADVELPSSCPDQADLIAASSNTPDGPAQAREALDRLRRLGGSEGIDLVLDYYKLDVLVAPADSALCELAAAAGYPIATTPLSMLRPQARPFGLALTTRAHNEHLLLHFASAWEALCPPVTPPPLDAVPLPVPTSSSSNPTSSPSLSRSPSSAGSSSAANNPSSSSSSSTGQAQSAPDAPIIRVILKEWDTRDFGHSSDALAAWLNARWRKSGYRVDEDVVWRILQASGREAWRGLGDRSQGAFVR
ncbi:amidase signature domain-containing protein [Phyllosticta paracitricarpa]